MMRITSYSVEKLGSATPLATPGADDDAVAARVESPLPIPTMPVAAAKRTSGTWLISLTAICFLFGVLLAMQLRAQQKVRQLREVDQGAIVAQQEIASLKRRVTRETSTRATLQTKVNTLQRQLALATSGSQIRSRQLGAQMKELQTLAGLTPVSGPGVVITLTDNPEIAKDATGSPFLPGIVHDFDLLQVVNELRAARAEAIALNGRRVTGYTPIRCVGPVIYVNGEAAAPPFRVEAIGDPGTLEAALKMPEGIVDRLKTSVGVRVATETSLHLPAVESAPRLRVTKSG